MPDAAVADAPAPAAAVPPAADPSPTVAAPVAATPADAAAQAAAVATSLTTPAPAAPVVPETYTLALPDGSTADPAIIERTAATARALGLPQDGAEKLLAFNLETLSAAAQANEALIASWQPGGEAWAKRDADWRTAALADPVIGGTPDKLAAAADKAQAVLRTFDPEGDLVKLLDATGFGSHPAAIRLLARIGAAMSEGTLALGSSPGKGDAPKTQAEKLYGPTGGVTVR